MTEPAAGHPQRDGPAMHTPWLNLVQSQLRSRIAETENSDAPAVADSKPQSALDRPPRLLGGAEPARIPHPVLELFLTAFMACSCA